MQNNFNANANMLNLSSSELLNQVSEILNRDATGDIDADIDDLTTNDINISSSTVNKLLGTDGSKNIVSKNITSFISGTSNEVAVTDNLDGTCTLGFPSSISCGLGSFSGLQIDNDTRPTFEIYDTDTDGYPMICIQSSDHDDSSIAFDAYNATGTWKSSDSGSNARILKTSDALGFQGEIGISQGNDITWSNIAYFNLASLDTVILNKMFCSGLSVGTGITLTINSSTGELLKASSCRASKTNIKPLTDISHLYDMEVVKFNYRNIEKDGSYSKTEYNPVLEYGLIADDLVKNDNDNNLVDYKDKKPYSIYYSKFIPMLIKAVQDQKSTIDAQKILMDNQKSTLQLQQALIDNLLTRVSTLEQYHN